MADAHAPPWPPAESEAFALHLLVAHDEHLEVALWCPADDQIEAWVVAALAALSHDSDARVAPGSHVELSVQLASATCIRQLNRQYRQRDSATNVLSFPADLPALENEDGSALVALGDLVLCPSVIATEAREQGKALEAHWAHMSVHGVLHLAGHDHENSADAALMEALEVHILAALSIANPYSERAVSDGLRSHG